jgi:LCP family protein required for cell wall assembly
MQPGRKPQRVQGAVLLAALLAALACNLPPIWQQPLGPSLGMPTRSPGQPGLGPPGEQADPSVTAGPTPEPLCGGPPVMHLLLVGSDTRSAHYLYGLADVVRLVRIDFVAPRVTLLEFPRDLWVEIPDISHKYGITHGKLNQAYLYGNRGMGYYNGPGEGPGLLARTLALNFNAQIDHYVAVNMQTFVRIVDAVGGITIYLPEEIDGNLPGAVEPDPDFVFPAGRHHFDGTQALNFARIRPIDTFNRAENQNKVLCALRERILSPSVLTRLPQLAGAFRNSVQTDLSPQQISQLICLAPHLDGQNLAFARFPRELFTRGSVYDPMLRGTTFIFEADYSVMREYTAAFTAGSWPDLQTGPQPAGSLYPSFCP